MVKDAQREKRVDWIDTLPQEYRCTARLALIYKLADRDTLTRLFSRAANAQKIAALEKQIDEARESERRAWHQNQTVRRNAIQGGFCR